MRPWSCDFREEFGLQSTETKEAHAFSCFGNPVMLICLPSSVHVAGTFSWNLAPFACAFRVKWWLSTTLPGRDSSEFAGLGVLWSHTGSRSHVQWALATQVSASSLLTLSTHWLSAGAGRGDVVGMVRLNHDTVHGITYMWDLKND